MKQAYHSNATTNVHIRCQIQKSHLPVNILAEKYQISENTVIKWKNRDKSEDVSSRPHTVHYSLSPLEQELIKSVRSATWFPLDEITEVAQCLNPSASRSAVYRTLRAAELNKVPQKEREKAKKFKAYEPGNLHIDITYLPKMDGKRQYLFVAIDRATRALYYQIYDTKTADNAVDFARKCIAFFPFKITHILTDNGLEFTNALLVSKKGERCTKPSKMDQLCKKENIDHRLTKPNTPKTNGMVERANGIIKKGTILKEQYTDKQAMETALMQFLVFYMLFRRHGSLKRELGVKTPFEAIEKWYELRPEIFSEKPLRFKNKLLYLKRKTQAKRGSFTQQPCET
ncbi:MAG: DDE-type integrase/transposase/recombinase [Flavobacteriales bacterium]